MSLLAFTIFAGAFLLEDATMVAAALLAASGMITPQLAFTSLYCGIVVSDWGIYGLGAAARSSTVARQIVGEDRIMKARTWLNGRLWPTLIGIRLLPGSRLPAYAASGFLRVPFKSFAGITAAVSLVWSAMIFTSVFILGMRAVMLGPWKYAVCMILGVAIVFGPSLWLRHSPRECRTGTNSRVGSRLA